MLNGWSRLRDSRLVRSLLSMRNLEAGKPKVQRSAVERPKMSIALPVRARHSTYGVAPTEIAIAAIFRNEAEYLKEWIEFHLMVGVDRFFLYDNNSTDSFLPILKPYIECEKAVLTPWATFLRDASAQRLAYAHAVCNCPQTVRWLVFIDIDEFLFSETSDDIKPIFTEFEDFAAITIPRFEFGPNGHKQKPPGLVIENYTRAGRRDMESGSSLNSKSAIEPFLATEIGTHKCIVDGVTLVVEPLDSGRLKLRINHYFSKSESEFQNKMRRGYSWKSQRGKSSENVFAKKSMLKNIADHGGDHYSMLHFVDRLKSRILNSDQPAYAPDAQQFGYHQHLNS